MSAGAGAHGGWLRRVKLTEVAGRGRTCRHAPKPRPSPRSPLSFRLSPSGCNPMQSMQSQRPASKVCLSQATSILSRIDKDSENTTCKPPQSVRSPQLVARRLRLAATMDMASCDGLLRRLGAVAGHLVHVSPAAAELCPASRRAKSPLRFGIVGAGMISQLHAAVLVELDEAELVAVFSRDIGRAAAITAEYGGTPTSEYAELLARDDIDCVSICTASGEHAEYGVRAADAGKHVLVEKPIDIQLDRADALVEACERNSVRRGVVFQLRFLDASREVKAAVDRGGT